MRHLFSKRMTSRKETGQHQSQAQQRSVAPLNLHADTRLQESWAQGHGAASCRFIMIKDQMETHAEFSETLTGVDVLLAKEDFNPASIYLQAQPSVGSFEYFSD